MRTALILSLFLCCAGMRAQQFDTISVWTRNDTVIVTDYAGMENCAARFAFEVTASSDTFRIVQRDTVKEKVRCNCRFELVTTLTGYSPGHYTASVYREYLAKFGYGSDTTVYIGSVDFDLATTTKPVTRIANRQSDCIMSEVPRVPNFELALYPLPLRSASVLSLDERWQGRVKATIYDERGRRLFVAFDREIGDHPRVVIDVSMFPASGMYHLVIESKEGIQGMLLPVVK